MSKTPDDRHRDIQSEEIIGKITTPVPPTEAETQRTSSKETAKLTEDRKEE